MPLSQLKNTIESWSESIRLNTYFMAMDEVGRGSLFGPVSVGGIIFPSSEILGKSPAEWHEKVRDSKKISPVPRKKLSEIISQNYISHTSHVSVSFIDRYNINKAIQYGVYRVANYLSHKLLQENPDAAITLILLDGNYRFQFPQIQMKRPVPPIKTIIKGDDTVFHISCASIIAKEARDGLLRKTSARFPEYHLEKNAGYGTALHREAILVNGLTPFHRREYVKKIANL